MPSNKTDGLHNTANNDNGSSITLKFGAPSRIRKSALEDDEDLPWEDTDFGRPKFNKPMKRPANMSSSAASAGESEPGQPSPKVAREDARGSVTSSRKESPESSSPDSVAGRQKTARSSASPGGDSSSTVSSTGGRASVNSTTKPRAGRKSPSPIPNARPSSLLGRQLGIIGGITAGDRPSSRPSSRESATSGSTPSPQPPTGSSHLPKSRAKDRKNPPEASSAADGIQGIPLPPTIQEEGEIASDSTTDSKSEDAKTNRHSAARQSGGTKKLLPPPPPPPSLSTSIDDIPRIPIPSMYNEATTPINVAKTRIKKAWEPDVVSSAPGKLSITVTTNEDSDLEDAGRKERKWRRSSRDTDSVGSPLEKPINSDLISLKSYHGASSSSPQLPGGGGGSSSATYQEISRIPTISSGGSSSSNYYGSSEQLIAQTSTASSASVDSKNRSERRRIVYDLEDRSQKRDDSADSRHSSSRHSSREREEFTFFFTKKYVYSNHYPCSFKIDGRSYNCSEQYYMYMKAKMFGDESIADAILSTSNPKEMKNLAMCIKDFDQEQWDDVSADIMSQANWEKYTQDKQCRLALLQTMGTTLVESSPNDRKWGIGLDITNPDRFDRGRWRGDNLLGVILTKIRDQLLRTEQYREEVDYVKKHLQQSRRRTA